MPTSSIETPSAGTAVSAARFPWMSEIIAMRGTDVIAQGRIVIPHAKKRVWPVQALAHTHSPERGGCPAGRIAKDAGQMGLVGEAELCGDRAHRTTGLR